MTGDLAPPPDFAQGMVSAGREGRLLFGPFDDADCRTLSDAGAKPAER